MKPLIPVLNGNDKITNDAFQRLRHPIDSEVEVTELSQYSRIQGVDLKPVITAESLRSLPRLAVQLKLSLDYYVDNSDVDDVQPYSVSRVADEKLTASSYKLHQFMMSPDDVVKAINSGLYEDTATFKTRLRTELLDKVVRRDVPVEIQKTTYHDFDFTLISDIGTEPYEYANENVSGFGKVLEGALDAVHEQYLDDIKKAEIEARQRLREAEAQEALKLQREKGFVELDDFDNPILSDGEMFNKIRDLELRSLSEDVAQILGTMTPEETVTIDDLNTDGEGSAKEEAVDFDEDELTRRLIAEDEFDSHTVVKSDEPMSDRELREKIRLHEESKAEEKSEPKARRRELDDDDFDLDL